MSSDPLPGSPSDPLTPRDEDLTVDLTFDGAEEDFDLQAMADQIAEDELESGHPSRRTAPPRQEVSDPIFEELERELAEATVRIQEFEQREAQHHDKHHRLLADFANYRNRTGRDIQMAVDQAERRLLLELLPVLDNFERCTSAHYNAVDELMGGVTLIQKQFQDALRRVGVERIPMQPGDPFDAQHAEALTTAADPSLPDGSIAAVYEPGFMLRDLLLRAARVVVNRHPDEGSPQ